jgi:hypothetical protein
VLPSSALARIPVRIRAPDPSTRTSPNAETETSPPSPDVNVTLWIWPPPEIRRLPVVTATRPALPVPELALEAMPLMNDGVSMLEIFNCPEVLTETLPASPRPKVDVEMIPPFRIEILSAATVMWPALPPLGSKVLANIPVPAEGLAIPFIIRLPETVTVISPPNPEPLVEAAIMPESRSVRALALTIMLPALPDPDVLVEITPPFPTTTRSLALTVTDPASPLLGPVKFELAKIPVSNCPATPLIERRSATATVTLPPNPVANVLLEISPVLTIDRFPALTLTIPAFPVLSGSVSDPMPAREVDERPSMEIPPVTSTETLPALPVPKAALKIAPLPVVDKDFALTLMFPEAPLLP